MWNSIKRSNSTSNNNFAINIDTLSSHFQKKFSAPRATTSVISNAASSVQQRYHALLDTNKWNNFVFSHSNVIRYINKLRNGSAAGITSEHLKFAKDSSLALHLSVVCSGFLIPFL